MCEFFVKADPIQYEQRTRTLRIRGVLTSLRLENMVWDVLAEMAAQEGRTTNALITLFHDEILAHRGEVPNFASFLRVTCMRHLRRMAELAAPGGQAEAAAVTPVGLAAQRIEPAVPAPSGDGPGLGPAAARLSVVHARPGAR